LADHDPGARRVAVDLDLALVLADRDRREPGVGELVLDVLADADGLEQVVGVLLLRVPGRLPVVDVADPHRLRMDLLSHLQLLRALSGVGSSTVVSVIARWLVRLWIGVARPSARGRKRLIVGPSSTVARWMRRSAGSSSKLFS